jgi:hypothetical protein
VDELPGVGRAEWLPDGTPESSRGETLVRESDHHAVSEKRRRILGEKRAVSGEEWIEIRRAHFVEKREVKSIAHELGLRRGVVRAVVSPWTE